MDLIIDNKIINAPIEDIVYKIKLETNNRYLKDVIVKNKNVVVTCPVHKGGQEKKPSCFICSDISSKIPYGTCHCFSCGYSGQLYDLVAKCFNSDIQYGKFWLINNFGDTIIDTDSIYVDELVLNNDKPNVSLDISILDKYKDNERALLYLSEVRHIKKEVANYFGIGYNKDRDSVTFPCYDEKNNLVMITERCISRKMFYIQKDIEKPVYLLNEIIKGNYQTVYVTESQINALTLWGWGYPAIALFGTGSSYQYDILKRSGITNYILCFDGDLAGYHGRLRFIKNMPKDVFISYKEIPQNKDVNDLTCEEFMSLPTLI